MSKLKITGSGDRAKISIDGWEPKATYLELNMRVGELPYLCLGIPITNSEIELDGVTVETYPIVETENEDERETDSTGILPDRTDDRCSDNVSNNLNNNGEKK
jgi:hypothetical protein